MAYQIYIDSEVNDITYILRINLEAVLLRYLGRVSGVKLRSLELWVTVVIRSPLSSLRKIKSREVKRFEHTIGWWREIIGHIHTT